MRGLVSYHQTAARSPCRRGMGKVSSVPYYLDHTLGSHPGQENWHYWYKKLLIDLNPDPNQHCFIRNKYWCKQYLDRYITKIYAQAKTREGDIIIQKHFFSPREDLASNAYALNMMRPGTSRFVRQFQQRIEAKQKVLDIQETL